MVINDVNQNTFDCKNIKHDEYKWMLHELKMPRLVNEGSYVVSSAFECLIFAFCFDSECSGIWCLDFLSDKQSKCDYANVMMMQMFM